MLIAERRLLFGTGRYYSNLIPQQYDADGKQ